MTEKKPMTYKNAGVDVPLGDLCSNIMYEASKKTWKNREGRVGFVREDFENFSGTRAFDAGELRAETKAGKNSDGVGTKMEVAERMAFSTGDFSYHKGIAHDLVAMIAGDADIRGAESVVMTNTLDVSHLNEKLIRALADGLVEACELGGIANISGEIAELGAKVGGYGGLNEAQNYFINWLGSNAIHSDSREIQKMALFLLADNKEKVSIIKSATVSHAEVFTKMEQILKNPVYNWSASLLWIQNHDKVIDGSKIAPGQSIVAIYEPGFGSNGLSLARKILGREYGQDWHMKDYGDKKLGELVLTPCTIHTKAIREMHGGYDETPKIELTGLAHITGGGIPGKLGRVLKASGYGAELTDLFEPMNLMRHCQEIGGTTDEEAYRTWNMGQRMMIVTPEPAGVIEIAGKYGFEGREAGKVITEPVIKLVSKGYHQNGDVLEFKLGGK